MNCIGTLLALAGGSLAAGLGYAVGHAVGQRAVSPLRHALADMLLLAEQKDFGGASRNKYRQLLGAVNGISEYWKDC